MFSVSREHGSGSGRRRRTLVILFTLTCLGCDGSSPTQPAPPGSLTVEYALGGRVEDTAFRPLAGVTIAVVEGTRAGVAAVTSTTGQYALPGTLTGPITLRVSKDGYEPRTRTYETTFAGPQSLDFTLAPIAAAASVVGDYTVTLTADPRCTELPEAVRNRSYAAMIRRRSPESHLHDVLLTGASFHPSGLNDRLLLGTAGDFGRFIADVEWGGGIVEELAAAQSLLIWGEADAPLGGATISASLSGAFEYCTNPGRTSFGAYRCADSPIVCSSRAHRLTLQRR